MTENELENALKALDESEVCDGCFMECEPYRSHNRGRWYPCRDEVRLWAKRHERDAMWYFEEEGEEEDGSD